MKLLGLHDILETERCILKIPEESDAEAMWEIITPKIVKYMIWNKGESYLTALENIKKARKKTGNEENWDSAIYLKSTGEIIGRCGFTKYNSEIPSLDIGYWITEKLWGQGIIPECVNRLLKYAFEESEFEKVIIRCYSENKNSAKVAEKCGFTFEGEFRNHERIKGELRDTKYFGITREDYFKK